MTRQREEENRRLTESSSPDVDAAKAVLRTLELDATPEAEIPQVTIEAEIKVGHESQVLSVSMLRKMRNLEIWLLERNLCDL